MRRPYGTRTATANPQELAGAKRPHLAARRSDANRPPGLTQTRLEVPVRTQADTTLTTSAEHRKLAVLMRMALTYADAACRPGRRHRRRVLASSICDGLPKVFWQCSACWRSPEQIPSGLRKKTAVREPTC